MRKPKFKRILSIDGGGIRGIIPGQILVRLEEKLQEIDPEARIADYFDMIVGTSTGGILTCAYLCPDPKNKKRPKFKAQEVVELYTKNGEAIFDRKAKHFIASLAGYNDEKYSAKNLEAILEEKFGDTLLSQLLKPCVVTSYDIERRHGHFFTQHDAKKKKGWDFKIKDIARSTSAAPTYFECAQIKSEEQVSCALIDGGVFVNNPALCGYAEAREYFRKKAVDMFILSLGTGKGADLKSYLYKDARNWGVIGWIKPLIDIMMSGASEVVDFQLKQIYRATKKPKQYVRINPEIPRKIDPDMDQASNKNIQYLKELGTETAISEDETLDNVVRMLRQLEPIKKP